MFILLPENPEFGNGENNWLGIHDFIAKIRFQKKANGSTIEKIDFFNYHSYSF